MVVHVCQTSLGKKQDPISKIREKMAEGFSSHRLAVWQAQGPEFKLPYH
jgi:hypothetical protein